MGALVALALLATPVQASGMPIVPADQTALAPDGLIRHYVRSNRDGSDPEHVVHFRPSRTDVAVYKWVEKCETAALVTAQLDPKSMEPLGLDAGKVARDGSQAKFGRIDVDPASRKVSAWADLPPGRVTDDAVMPTSMPWFLYDYDLGDLNAWLQDKRPDSDFMFAWGLIWPEGENFLTHMATIHAASRGIEDHDGKPARRFDLHFIAGKEGSGTLWVDPQSWAIVEAETSLPNHPGMKDFRLKLERVDTGGVPAWQTLMKAHYAGCPA